MSERDGEVCYERGLQKLIYRKIFLSPGADPVPKDSCRGARAIPKDAVEMLAGGSGLVTAAGKINIKIGSCEPFSIAKNVNGLAINANIFDHERKLVANITNNQFFVRYMNPSTIRIRGQFFCPDEPPVYVTDDSMEIDQTIASRNCAINLTADDYTWFFVHRHR
jgi:hypothetical protein